MKLGGDFEKLVLIADSQTLGRFREVMHKTVEAGLVLTLARDLTNHPARVPHAVSATGHTSARTQTICMRGFGSASRRWVAD